MKKQILSLALAASMVLTAALPAAGAESAKHWSEKRTPNGWTMVTNEGGKTLGYSKSSGVSILEVDGYAFKDLNRNGQLDTYEDWRLDNETRARALADSLSVEEMTPLFTHGGWSSFGSTIEGTDLEYVQGGGRGGVTRSAASSGNRRCANPPATGAFRRPSPLTRRISPAQLTKRPSRRRWTRSRRLSWA